MKNIETKQLEVAEPDPAAIVFVFKAGAFRYQRTITYNISPSSSSTNQNAGSGERRRWRSWLWHRCCDFPRITTGALSSNENGGKVIMRGIRQAETVGKSLWRDINLEAWEKISRAPSEMASEHSGMASFLVLLLQAEQLLMPWTTVNSAFQ